MSKQNAVRVRVNAKGRVPEELASRGKRGYIVTMLYNLLNSCFIGCGGELGAPAAHK